MVENNSADNTLEGTLCHGTLPVSGIHQNTSYVICCITTRPTLLINDCFSSVSVYLFAIENDMNRSKKNLTI